MLAENIRLSVAVVCQLALSMEAVMICVILHYVELVNDVSDVGRRQDCALITVTCHTLMILAQMMK